VGAAGASQNKGRAAACVRACAVGPEVAQDGETFRADRRDAQDGRREKPQVQHRGGVEMPSVGTRWRQGGRAANRRLRHGQRLRRLPPGPSVIPASRLGSYNSRSVCSDFCPSFIDGPPPAGPLASNAAPAGVPGRPTHTQSHVGFQGLKHTPAHCLEKLPSRARRPPLARPPAPARRPRPPSEPTTPGRAGRTVPPRCTPSPRR
jgi:hypothetical protein